MSSGRQRRRQRRLGLLAAAIAVGLAAAPAPPAGAADPERSRLELREGDPARVPADVRRARRALRERLGRYALLSADPATGAVRALGRLDGTLTGRSRDGAGAVARAYARDQAAVLGLEPADVDALRLARRRPAGAGLEQVVFEQRAGGIPAIDSSLRAIVDDAGRLVTLGGAPRPLDGAPTRALVGPVTAYRAAASAAGATRSAAGADERPGPTRRTTFANGDSAALVLYEDGPAVRLGWRVFVQPSSTEYYDTVVDARSGVVARRVNRVRFASAPVFRSYPGAPTVPGGPAGGVQTVQDIGPLDAPGTRLRGPNVHAFLDRDDVVAGGANLAPTVPGGPAGGVQTIQDIGPLDAPDRLRGPNVHAFLDRDDVVAGGANLAPPRGDETPPTLGGNFSYPLTPFAPGKGSCPSAPPHCTWDPFAANSWLANADQDATQLFYSVNRFHDHLAAAPIGFTAASGNFEDDDRIVAQAMDGANTAGGRPDERHHSNANMLTLPDGQPGYMQMYLFDPAQSISSHGVSGANDATIVFHEYAHGMIHRLVTDPQGFGALNTAQAGAIDEGLADWYALDHLVDEGLLRDGPEADVVAGAYPAVGGLRSQPADCPVGDKSAACPGQDGSGPGGYTYGDFGRVSGGGPEVHADGEIWGGTAWQLRSRLIADHGPARGVARARELITLGLRLAPDNPSFLDLRNAILQADTQTGGADRAALWSVFAERGMGYFASTEGSDDTAPIEDFSLPPAPAERTATVSGTVREAREGPQAGVLVAFSGHDSGLGEDLAATTDADGRYTIAAVPRTYPHLVARGPGGLEEVKRRSVTVTAGANRQDFTLRRNLASAAAGGRIPAGGFTGNDNTRFGCGPGGLIDGTGRTVWGTETPAAPAAQEITVRLARSDEIGEIAVDPSAGCGDTAASALGAYEVQVSRTGAAGSFTAVGGGTFGPADNGRLNRVALTARPGDAGYVKLRALSTQGGAPADRGYLDVAELAVYAGPPAIAGGPAEPVTPPAAPGAPSPPAPAPPAPVPPTTSSGPAAARAAVTCATRRGRRSVRVACRLREARGARTARLRLSRAGRTVARSAGKVRGTRLPALTVRRAGRRTYALTVTVTGRKGTRARRIGRTIRF